MLIYGANGFTKLVIDCLESRSVQIDGIFDDDPVDCYFDKYSNLGKYHSLTMQSYEMILAFEDNLLRKCKSENVSHNLGTIFHSSAVLSPHVLYGPGTMILHNASVLPDVTIGKHCIINAGAVVEHDCDLKDFVNVGQGAAVCSNVSIGMGTHIGPSATVLANIKIGEWVTVAAGSTIINDIPDFAIVVGNPGKIVKYRNSKVVKGKPGTFTPVR